jgi:hypothetical protein
MNEITAVIYPVPLNLVDRFFSEKKSVFVKYLARNTQVQISPKNKMVFYASHGSKEIVGDGAIESVEFLTPDEVLAKYDDKVFLNKEELKEYMLLQPRRTSSKKLLTLNLSKIRKYRHPIRIEKPITMTGQYLSRDEYREMVGH